MEDRYGPTQHPFTRNFRKETLPLPYKRVRAGVRAALEIGNSRGILRAKAALLSSRFSSQDYLLTGIENSGPLLAAASGQRCITLL